MSILQVAAVVSEVGDLSNYRSARQLIKLAGLNLVENSSGSHKGRSRISKRGRSKLRCTLSRVALILVARTQEFSLLHHYYTTRPNNPLKGKQSLVAICCKLLRIIFALSQKKMVYDKNMFISQDHPAFMYMKSAVKSKKQQHKFDSVEQTAVQSHTLRRRPDRNLKVRNSIICTRSLTIMQRGEPITTP